MARTTIALAPKHYSEFIKLEREWLGTLGDQLRAYDYALDDIECRYGVDQRNAIDKHERRLAMLSN